MSQLPDERRSGSERRLHDDMRLGSERRRSVERRNGLSVLLAGCPDCDRIAPPPVELQGEGWLVQADERGITLIACPDHRHLHEATTPQTDEY